MRMQLAIGISTMNDSIYRLSDALSNIPDNIELIVCHQITNGSNYNYDHLDEGVIVVKKYERGLSKSRNALVNEALKLKCDYLIISDDDVKYNADGLNKLLLILSDKHFVDTHIQFKSGDLNDSDRKKYKLNESYLSKLDVFKVSSIEMCLNIKCLSRDLINFDERFGLGAQYPVGEEAVLLSDALQKGHKIKFLPIKITIHPIESTGILLFTQPKMISARGAIFRRCFGPRLGLLYTFLFWTKKFFLNARQEKRIGNIEALKYMVKGCFYCE